jgi:hypothetical protein
MFDKGYQLLVQEGHLTMSSLLGGLNSIRNANIDDAHRGLFYSGLFELATGFERLMKIVVLLEHKINNQLQNPTDKQLRSFGHNIKELHSNCTKFAKDHGLKTVSPTSEVQDDILEVLSTFAKGSRYYNLDQLTSGKKNEDPIEQWLSVIQYHIWGLRSDVREKLETEALQVANVDNWQQNINGEWITDCEFYYLLKATEKSSYHVVWSIISILKPFYYLLQTQTRMLHQMGDGSSTDIPYLYEFFPFVLASKRVVLRKKNWAWGK